MTTSNASNDPITSTIDAMSKLQGLSNPDVLAALQQVATAVKQVQSIICWKFEWKSLSKCE